MYTNYSHQAFTTNQWPICNGDIPRTGELNILTAVMTTIGYQHIKKRRISGQKQQEHEFPSVSVSHLGKVEGMI